MLLRMTELAEKVAGSAAVVAPPGRYAGLGLEIVPDHWPGAGPLGGIATALSHTAETMPGCAWNLILGCDLPFLTEEWLTYLLQRTQSSPAAVVLPVSAGGFLEPLCAAYRTEAGAALAEELGRGVRKITQALESLQTETLDEPHWKRFDSAGRLFRNMNTAADYNQICAEWGEQSR